MLRAVCLSLLLCCAPLSVADTVWLDNGDRISGSIDWIEGGKLLVRTEFAGAITVDLEQVVTLEADGPLLVRRVGQTDRVQGVKVAEQSGMVVLQNGSADVVALSELQQVLAPQPLIADARWEGNARAALDIRDSEIKRRDLDVALDTQVRLGDWRHGIGAEYERDKSDGTKIRHNWEADYDLSWFFAEKWFWNTSLGYRRDYMGDIAMRRQVGMGPGYEWWNNPLGRFETAARLDYIEAKERNGDTLNATAAVLEWSYRRFLWGKRFELFHNAETVFADDALIRYGVDADLGMRYLLNSWMTLSVLADWDYLRSSQGQDVNDRRYRFALGVNW
ncbi:DUF481 domain-containing protein [Halopseudomonas salegens]|uniref:Salt-induced outer membrane protein YdiY n=1 Tax=Halopseudomonas salegens TaxID=1434072 RepID=A0A1H2EMB1_9GAMM|nr:DUF481 domain-containing protein [Halopseudomonas salegens]SDT96184.1 Protein of unknown function, DUF481 [Halopseudomonas salegens]